MTVTSEETRLAMLGQTVSILGQEYTVSAPRATKNPRNSGTNRQNGLEDLYYLDIVGTRYNFDAHLLLKGLRRCVLLRRTPFTLLTSPSTTRKRMVHERIQISGEFILATTTSPQL